MSFKSLAALSALLVGQVSAQGTWLSPVYNHIFAFPLPIPPIKQPLTTVESDGRVVDYFEIDVIPFEAQIYPELPATPLVGYDGMAPGPTFRVTRGREAVVRFRNQYDRPSAIHLHGSFSRAPWDGWAADLIQPGQYKDYYYPNAQSERTLWYHDHAEAITAQNANEGQAGFYILDDPEQDFGFPTGDYDVPLMLASRQFNPDGTLFNRGGGDVITVNAQPWPYLNVEPRKYRFRLLDASITRVFQLTLAVDETSESIPFTVIASDSAYLSRTVVTEDIVVAMAERWDVIIDFEQFAGQNITMHNNGAFHGQQPLSATDRVMRFVVGNEVTDTSNNGPIPTELQDLPRPEDPIPEEREFNFTFAAGGRAVINGIGFADVDRRILATPQRGNVERWILRNPTGGTHPVHIHLVDFQIVSRTALTATPVRPVTPYEAEGLKDIAYLDPQSEVEVLANFAPWPGLYMFHCHNLNHEDNDMMAAFNVTITPEELEELGYGPESLLDPESPEFAAQDIVATDIEQIRTQVIPGFTALNAYPELARIASAEWVSADSPEAEQAPDGFGPPPEPQLKRAARFRA